ncbi:SusC/RagA family TonB-linked outer membrane protein [Pseudalgibacter alginicilyticus]|nr:SusC/RagA family TonB-linked outer membrane protein [Pseudalgibacter alginicilyticus]
MRTFIFLLCTSMFSFTPNYVLSQNSKIRIEKDVTISVNEVFNIIKEQTTDYMFIYRDDLFNNFPEVQLKKGVIKLDKLLEESLSGGNVNLTVTPNKTILIRKKSPEDNVQRQISGKVVDEFGEPIPGVTVLIKGEGVGTSTNLEGVYHMIVPNIESVLIFSSIGYKSQEIKVGNQTSINITLKENLNQLGEVVINGVFERKAESFTGAAVTITKEELRKVGSQNIFQAIQNIDPSIALVEDFSLGSNPNNLPDMQIRGTSTFPSSEAEEFKGNYLQSPNQPLFILNGFEASVERVYDIDFNRIKRLTILKDAASKALYGSKAANGVIVIETETPTGQEVRITYNANLDLELPDLSSYNLTNSLQKLQAETLDGYYLSRDSGDYVELQQLYNSRLKLAQEGLNTDWMAVPLQNGIGQRHSIGVELGSEHLSILANLNYQKKSGAMKESFRENIGGNLTVMYKIDKIKFQNSISVTGNNTQESPYGDFSDYSKMNPYWRAYDLDGTIPYYSEYLTSDINFTNPLYNTTLETKDVSSYLNFVNNFYLEWDVLPSLKAIARVGIDLKRSDADEFYPGQHTLFDTETDDTRKGSYQVNNGKSSYFSGDFNVQYSKSLQKHFLFANGGFNVSERKYEETSHLAEGFPSSRLNDITFARTYALDASPTGISGISRELGFLAVGSYVYDNRFLSDVTLRTSASSQFGEDNRWSTFWSLGLGWNIHNEAFLRNSIVEQLKLRGSLGSTGNQNFNTNQSIVTYAYYQDKFYQDNPGSYLLNMGNSELQWETKFDYNIGLDTKIENLTLRLDYYESYTENLITDITLPYSTGFNSVNENLGKVKNSGIELNASYLVWSKGRNFFNVNFGITTNDNKIIELSDAMKSFNEAQDAIAGDDENNKPVIKYQDGMSMNAIWAVPSKGIDPATGLEVYVKQDGSTTYEWDANDMVVVGDSNSKYRGVFGISGEFEGFGISITARYLGGGQLYNQTLVDKVENVDMDYNVDQRVLTGRWQYQGQQTEFKGLRYYNYETGLYNYNVTPTKPTSRFVQDRKDFDIAAINVYYDFNKNVTDAIGAERLRIGFNANNVVQFSSIEIERGTSYPYAQSMSFSLTANF